MRFLAHQVFLNPGFWIFSILIAGVILNYKKRLWVSIPLLFLSMLLFSKPVQYLFALEERKFPTWESEKKVAPYILVLGAGGTPEQGLSPMHRIGGASFHRVMQGISIWKQLPEARLVFTGAGVEGYVSLAEMYAEVAREWGVPDAAINIITTPKNTQEEAKDFMAKFPGTKSVILVTSAMHIQRAKKIFEKQGLEVITAPSDYRVKLHPDGIQYSWIPSLDAMQMWSELVKEKVGIMLVSG
ncbi:YdcF family protein [Aquiflexum sp. LQ15W]|uniref:YdcF family protein n=1 Tax=Cognataquiflexum nitidum TaxID=2922272 RepID=UPI001F13463E|nr:ElyC/SanA/YdcF family protein [Cognataquiflexum nitidum]MCH6201330.1 YdcF family protein [Cognataquiflexum nitidum]